MNSVVLGISPDSLSELARFRDEHRIGFAMLSDPDKTIQRLYEPGRKTYIIDKQGIIRYRQEGVPDNEKLLEVLRSLQ